MTRTE